MEDPPLARQSEMERGQRDEFGMQSEMVQGQDHFGNAEGCWRAFQHLRRSEHV